MYIDALSRYRCFIEVYKCSDGCYKSLYVDLTCVLVLIKISDLIKNLNFFLTEETSKKREKKRRKEEKEREEKERRFKRGCEHQILCFLQTSMAYLRYLNVKKRKRKRFLYGNESLCSISPFPSPESIF